MNKISLSFLSILKYGIQGLPAEGFEDLTAGDWNSLFELAMSHKVLPLFADAVYPLPGAQEKLRQTRPFLRQQLLVQTLKTAEFLRLYQALEEAGIRPLVVKGIVCRSLYPKPDLRVSSDEDLLVPPEQFDAARRVLEDFGLEWVSTDSDANELPYRQKGGSLYIELHRCLFPQREEAYGDWNQLFTGAFDRAVAENIQGVSIRTLDPTDHLFFLISHAMKHFLHSGFGIRQVCDLVLFANAYGEQLDWDRVTALCEQIHGLKFAAALFRIGGKYLTFDPDRARYPESWRAIGVDVEPLLEDLLSGGVYGTADLSRQHSSNITLEAASGKTGKEKGVSLRGSLFPPAKKLENAYPYLKKHPWLLPAAWGQRMVKYALETGSGGGSSALDAVKIGRRRVELLRQYGIIDAENDG